MTKGAALQRLMQNAPFRGRTPIFAGDDSTDEDAFEVVNRLGGISVQVGAAERTAATCHLTDPEALRRWLVEIAQT
jgi:trehalose 6-phosphate phosphatase